MNVAYNMDCLAAMREMPDKCFDLAVVDPPYGGVTGGYVRDPLSVGKMAKATNYNFALWDQRPPTKEWFSELQRVSKNQIIWGGNHLVEIIQKNSPCWIVWDKENGGTDYADCELAWTSFTTSLRKFTFRWSGMLQGDMKNKEIRIHPTQKPVALYAWIFSRYANPGDKILDTHLGSGSSRIAAYDAGLDFVGYEIDKEYFDKQEERYREHISQLSLFVGGAE